MKPGNRQYHDIEMVPIHTKHFALIDERKEYVYNAFLLICRKAFFSATTMNEMVLNAK